MTAENVDETVASTARARAGFDEDWTRLEGVAGLGALVTSFVWFLGMPTGMAIGVGFGIVSLLDVVRHAISVSSKRGRTGLEGPETMTDGRGPLY